MVLPELEVAPLFQIEIRRRSVSSSLNDGSASANEGGRLGSCSGSGAGRAASQRSMARWRAEPARPATSPRSPPPVG